MPTQSCGHSVSAPRGKAGARFNAHTELRAKRQRSAREAITEVGLLLKTQGFAVRCMKWPVQFARPLTQVARKYLGAGQPAFVVCQSLNYKCLKQKNTSKKGSPCEVIPGRVLHTRPLLGST